MTIEHFTKANEGTYTIQIHDGKAKSQSSLVLVGDGNCPTVFIWCCWGILAYKPWWPNIVYVFQMLAFKVALKEAEFQRKEHIRKQGLWWSK